MKLAFFYDQSLLVRDSVGSVWESDHLRPAPLGGHPVRCS